MFTIQICNQWLPRGVELANGGVVLSIGNQSATVADRMPIENADRNQLIMDYLKNHDNVTTAELADYLGLSQRTVRNILKELVENGLVDKVSSAL